MKLTVIGGGNMGLTFAKGIQATGLLGEQISILEKGNAAIKNLKAKEKDFLVFDDPTKCVTDSDIIIIAVKPFHAKEVFENIKHLINNDQLFISLMAGVKICSIISGLGVSKIVRCMPNLPAMIGKGITGYTVSKEVKKADFTIIEAIISSTGKAVLVNNEDDIDKITGLSGSGSAYIFYFMEAMMKAAEEFGFSEFDAKTIVTQTFEGAVSLYKQNDISTTDWIDKVCSKGGTTIAAIESFENNEVKKGIITGIKAAYHRAIELGKE